MTEQSPICLYCEATTTQLVGDYAVCESEACVRQAKRDTGVPLSELLARYGEGKP